MHIRSAQFRRAGADEIKRFVQRRGSFSFGDGRRQRGGAGVVSFVRIRTHVGHARKGRIVRNG